MENAAYVIGLDYGTLSGRGILVRCADGHVMAEAVREYTHGVMNRQLPDGTRLPDNGWNLEHPADYLEVLDTVIPGLIRDSGADPDRIVGIGIDFTSCTMLPVDAGAVPLCMKEEFASRRNAYVKLWKHHGADAQAQKINRILDETGLGADVRFGGKCSSELMMPKVMETLQEDPQVYEAADEFLEAGDWLTRVLTSSRNRSSSMAGYKMWWNQEQGYPPESFFASLDGRLKDFISRKMPGKVCPMGSRIGRLNAEWAGRLGLREGTSVAPSIIDSHAGVPGSGVAASGQMMLVLGTSSVLAALSRTPFSGKGVMGGVRDAVVPGYYMFESGLACVGDLFAWYMTNMLPACVEREAKQTGKDLFRLLNEKAEKKKPGENGLLALGWWNGNKTPFVDAALSGSLMGMTLETRPEDIYRALIESTAFDTRVILDLFEAHGSRAEEIVASGGIAAKNPFLMQVYADICEKPIRVAASSQTAALGAAIYGALAAGEEEGGFSSYQEAVKRICPASDLVYSPNPAHIPTYRRLYGWFRKAARSMGDQNADLLHGLHGSRQGMIE